MELGPEQKSDRNKAKRKLADYKLAMAEKSRVAMAEYRKRSRNISVFDDIGAPNFRGLSARYCVGGPRRLHITNDNRLRLIPLCKLALEKYNAENKGANFVFEDLVKSTYSVVAGTLYYITFQAKEEEDPSNSPATTFQAKVWNKLAAEGPPEVRSCAMKST